MARTRVVRDLAECRALWEETIPPASLTDLWEVRACFQRHFRRPPCFVVAEEGGRVTGLLPLSWIEGRGHYGYFPGETWKGKTWLEQNRVPCDGPAVLDALLEAVPGACHLRYLLPGAALPAGAESVDETGYLFRPGRYGFEMDGYLTEFSGKSAKRLRRELAAFEQRGVAFHYDAWEDLDLMFRMNVEGFGEDSYFADPRFLASFRDLARLLRARGWLRVTTLLVEGRVAAVDMGCLRDGVYTLLAGGTDPAVRGAAKLINLHHMARACAERMEEVDFLCGDFNWKTLFHLTPRPLFLLTSAARAAAVA